MHQKQLRVQARIARTVGGDPAGVHNLAEEERALAVDGVDDGLPRLHLLPAPDPRRVRSEEGDRGSSVLACCAISLAI